MKRILPRILAAALYLLAAAAIMVYFRFIGGALPPAERLALVGFECLCAYFASLFISRTISPDGAKRLMRATFFLFFALYSSLLLAFTLLDPFYGRASGQAVRVNLIPFATIGEFILAFFAGRAGARDFITNIFGNLLAFAPFALFLPLLFKKLKPFGGFLLAVVFIAAAVEAAQLMTGAGACDVDDVILNAAGAAALYGILHLKPIKRLIDKATYLDY